MNAKPGGSKLSDCREEDYRWRVPELTPNALGRI